MLTIMLLSALLFVVYQLASSSVPPGYEELEKQNRFLRQELDLLAERNAKGQARLAVLEQETEVVRKANRLLREEEAGRQAEINRLRTELDFYSRLAGTGGEQISGGNHHQSDNDPGAMKDNFSRANLDCKCFFNCFRADVSARLPMQSR